MNGSVKFFNNTKGFGFIKPDNGSEDIFVHSSGLKEKIKDGDHELEALLNLLANFIVRDEQNELKAEQLFFLPSLALAELLQPLSKCIVTSTPWAFDQEGQFYFPASWKEMVKVVAVLESAIKQWRAEVVELQCQLGIPCRHLNNEHTFDGTAYKKFFAAMMELNADTTLSAGLRAIMTKSFPLLECTDTHVLPYQCQLDMRDQQARELYLMAATMYLEWRRWDIAKLKAVCIQFNAKAESSPKSMRDLLAMLDGSPAQKQLALFKINCLLRLFQQTEHPGYKSTLSIDAIFPAAKSELSKKGFPEEVKQLELQTMGSSPARQSGL